MNDFTGLTPEQLALLQDVSDPDLPIAGLPPIYTVQLNSRRLLNLPELGAANPHVPGAMGGGFVVPNREGRIFMPSPPGFTFAVFAFTKEFAIFEILPDNKGLRFIGSHPEMPEDAAWKDSPNGRICRDSKGRVVQEARNAFMKVEETGQFGCYASTRRPCRSAAISPIVAGSQCRRLESVKGCVLGRYRMTSRLKRRTPAAGSCRSRRSASLASRTVRRSPPCSSWPSCARPSSPACHRCWRSKDRRSRLCRRPSMGRQSRRRTSATRMTTSTSALEDNLSSSAA